MGNMLRIGPALIWLAVSLPTQANSPEHATELHLDPAWLTLIHYQPDRFGSGYTSQADDPAFFLSENGKHSPRAELKATLDAIQKDGEGDDHALCRFPARATWLSQQLDLSLPEIECPGFQEWSETLNTETVTLVFAASYLNSPSSMFGHTFLRLDPPQDDEETNLLLANTPGSAPLESSALLGFLPAISRHLLGEELALPSLATWWCGEDAALREVLPLLNGSVIKPTYPRSGLETVMGQSLGERELDEWSGRMARHPDNYTVQSWLPLSQTPTWSGERLMPRSAMLRVFALADGPRSWRVLPGGMVRLAPRGQLIAAMQRGGSSADCWVLTDGAVDHTSLLQSAPSTLALAQQKQPVTSRAAENLFWLGRYTERAENSVRLAQIVLNHMGGEEPTSRALMAWLSDTASENALVLPDAPAMHKAADFLVNGGLVTGTVRPDWRELDLPGLEAATRMILDLCGGEPSEIVVAGAVPDHSRAYRLDTDRVQSLVGLDIAPETQRETLAKLGFRLDGDTAHVPSWRPDVQGDADLVEEVARIASLTGLKGKPLPRVTPGVPRPVLTLRQRRMQAARRTCAALGYNECVTYSFIDRASAELFSGGTEATMLENPISSDMSHMRPALLPGLLQAAARNQARGYADLSLFECGPAFEGGEPGEEHDLVTGLRVGRTSPKDVH